MLRLAGKVAFVTAAGGGIAGAVARRFATEGAAVYAVDIDAKTVTETVATITGDGGRATTLDDWNEVLDVNLTGMFLVSKHAIPHLRRAGGGSIISVASTFGHIAWPERPAYMATKGAVRQLSRSIALDFGGDGIRANSISPGHIETNRLLQRTATMEQVRERAVPLYPIGRLGQPDDIANAALYLVSGESSFVTGADMLVDGGFAAI